MAAAPTAAVVGDRVFARDRVGAWLLGDVMDERGEGDERLGGRCSSAPRSSR
jgi:hypothetical protein